MQEIEQIGNLPEKVVVICPLDPEVIYTGSKFSGPEIWSIFVKEVRQRGLEGIFTSIKRHLDYFWENSKEKNMPHKDLDKWTAFSCQKKFSDQIRAEMPKTERGRILYSLAATSDILAAWWFKRNPGAKVIAARDRNGRFCKIIIKYNPELIKIPLLAFSALKSGESFHEKLNRINPKSLFVQRLITFAQERKL